jgi:hypothetical protein
VFPADFASSMNVRSIPKPSLKTLGEAGFALNAPVETCS